MLPIEERPLGGQMSNKLGNQPDRMNAPILDQADQERALLQDMETMLREKIALNPGDLNLRMRLISLLVESSQRDGFVQEAQLVWAMLQPSTDHPALAQLSSMARRLKINPARLAQAKPRSPRRRLGEDPAALEYFQYLHDRFSEIRGSKQFQLDFDRDLIRNYNRPSSLMHAQRLSAQNRGAQIAIKREDLMGPGSKLVMTVVGQVLMAKKLGFTSVVTGCSFSRSGVIMSAVAARVGLRAMVFIDERQTVHNSAHKLRMRCVGARIGTIGRHQDAREAAVEYCLKAPQQHFLVLGVEAAPSAYAKMNQFLVSALGRETRSQALSLFKRSPDLLVCRGKQTADAIGLFDPFLDQEEPRLVCVEALDAIDSEPATEESASFHITQLTQAQMSQADVILEGSEYPAVKREHADYKASGRVEYVAGSSLDARTVTKSLAQLEGLICPVRTAYALGWATRAARDMPGDQLVVVNLIEPCDKDLREIAQVLGVRD